jgi:adenylyltransferase/sulfurtransferase
MHATLIGAGNIGSHAAPLLAQIPGLTRLTMIDRDVYEPHNLKQQSILASDVGKPKAEAQGRHLRRVNPRLEIVTHYAQVEDLPLGLLRASVLVAAVDTRTTRQYINEAAWTLGLPWIDSGVSADGGLVRIGTYNPGSDSPCLECHWGEREYALLETRFACGASTGVPRTNAPASLGGLAGALLAIEAEKILTGRLVESLANRELVISSQWHKQHLISLHRNPRCRFSHETPRIEAGPPVSSTVRQVVGNEGALSTVCGAEIVAVLRCLKCHRRIRPWRLKRSLRPSDRLCTACLREMPVDGLSLAERIDASAPKRILDTPLVRLGFRAGDVIVSSSASHERYLELGEE